VLLKGLTDSNRLVRLRAAEALVGLEAKMTPIFQRVVETQDRYGLHAYLTALENANLRKELETELHTSSEMSSEERSHLQEVLSSGTLPAEELMRMEHVPGRAGPRA
jgi:HEAT repeat protein